MDFITRQRIARAESELARAKAAYVSGSLLTAALAIRQVGLMCADLSENIRSEIETIEITPISSTTQDDEACTCAACSSVEDVIAVIRPLNLRIKEA